MVIPTTACLLCTLLPAVTLAVSAAAQPVQLTSGPGDHTEAAWSPDGATIAFDLTRDGDHDLCLVNVETGEVRTLVGGPGDALYPAWSPDGKSLAYAFQHITTTAVQGIPDGCGIFLVPAAGGEPRRLTGGLVRDYVPTFSPDGQSLLFSSSREAENPSVGIFRLNLAGGEPQAVLAQDAADTAFLEPDISPDGRFIAHSFIATFRANWAVRLARMGEPNEAFTITDPSRALYAPVWSPDGKWLCCTGYSDGDAGWGIYAISLPDGAISRLDTGPGNSRSPDWSPDGKRLVFENNRSGSYQLYTMPFVPPVPTAGPDAPTPDETREKPVVRFSFDAKPGETVDDLSGTGNSGRVTGSLDWQDGAIRFDGGGYVDIASPEGLNFGTGPFTVSADLTVARHTGKLRIIAMGTYPNSALGWQLYLNEDGQMWFNSRGEDNTYVGARSDLAIPEGKRLTVLGYRDASGKVCLVINGATQLTVGSGAGLSYPDATALRLGRQYSGSAPAEGVLLHRFEVGPGVPTRSERISRHLQEFLR